MIGVLETSGIWVVTIGLFLIGLLGCVVPVLPGHLLIFGGVVAYRLMEGVGAGIAWWSYLILIVMMAVSQTFEIFSGAVGARWFGGSRWGALGALVGAVAGLLFFPIGLLLGPLLGAIGFEIAFGKRELKASMTSGVGSLIGTVAGMVVKVGVGLLMIGWFFVDVFLLG